MLTRKPASGLASIGYDKIKFLLSLLNLDDRQVVSARKVLKGS